MVGLSNVDNTTDLLKPVSTATQTALDLKGNLVSPTFSGIPVAPTAVVGTNTTQLATTAFVLENTGSGSSGVNTATQTALDLKANLASPTFSGILTTSQLALTSTAINLGSGAATTTQGASSVAVGDRSATTNQGAGSVAIGVQSATTNQGLNAVAIGNLAGNDTQRVGSVAVGYKAGQTSQFSNSVAIGYTAGQTNLQTGGIAIGNSAGNNNCGSNSVCIGSSTVATNGSSVAIGNAATTVAFSSSVALGNGATATAANQIRLGTATETVSIPGTLSNPGLTSALGLKANLANPTFTGVPVAPTAGSGTNTTQVATTAFVIQNIASETGPILDGKANLASPTFTGTVSGVDKTMVGLSSVENTTDLQKVVSTATQTALNLKANLGSPALTGIPVAPTAATGTNTTQLATCAFVLASAGSGGSGSIASFSGTFPAAASTQLLISGSAAVENSKITTIYFNSTNTITATTINIQFEASGSFNAFTLQLSASSTVGRRAHLTLLQVGGTNYILSGFVSSAVFTPTPINIGGAITGMRLTGSAQIYATNSAFTILTQA